MKPLTPWPPPPSVTWRWSYGPNPLRNSLGVRQLSTKSGPSWAVAAFQRLSYYRDPRGVVKRRWHGASTARCEAISLRRMLRMIPELTLLEPWERKPNTGHWMMQLLTRLLSWTRLIG